MASHAPNTNAPEPCGEHVLPVTGDVPARSETVQRAQWLRAAILGASDGLLSTTSLMLGVGAVKDDRWSMALSGAAGAVAGAFSMAIGELVSVSTQRDIEKSVATEKLKDRALPSPAKAGAASGVAFMAGAVVPLVSGVLVSRYRDRVVALVVAASVGLAGFGGMGAHLGGSPVGVSAARMLIGGWVAMGITYLLLKRLDRDDDGV